MKPRLRMHRLRVLQDFLSFNSNVRHLVDTLDREIQSPDLLPERASSHPLGLVREVSQRRLTIAESYLKLMTLTGVERWRDRLDALRLLMAQAWHAKTLVLPMNTARVQVALMKQCLERRGDRRRQLELMADFELASHGQVPVIRRLLRELDLIEVPEDGRPLRDHRLGFDDHVHDFLTEGRKTPSQLVLDAFIKGISNITVVYYDLSDHRIFEETIRAGEILGIQVNVGVEFSVGRAHDRLHFMYLPPGSDSVDGLVSFLEANKGQLEPFFAGLTHNAGNRVKVIQELLEQFNDNHLRELNAQYHGLGCLQVRPLESKDLADVIQGGRASRIHLGQLLWYRVMPVLHGRVVYLKNQLRFAQDKAGLGVVTSWEVEQLRARYQQARQEYESCSPTLLQDRFLPSREIMDYDSAFVTPADIFPILGPCGGRVAFIHPLSQGVRKTIGTLVDIRQWITDIELFNTADSVLRNPADMRHLALFVGHLNNNRPEEARRMLLEWRPGATAPEELDEACAWYQKHPLRGRAGSDYVGQKDRVTGMGFIGAHRLDRESQRVMETNHHACLGGILGEMLLEREHENGKVYLLSPSPVPLENRVGDEAELEPIGVTRFWRYLNPDLKFIVKLAIGFTPATLVVGPGYAALWFAITGTRNILVDMISSAGGSLRAWRLSDVDKDNLANSLFWTGFSTPILGGVKFGFDWAWPLLSAETGFLKSVVKFFFLAFTNGSYLSLHNWFRGFDKQVIRGNFFRSVLAWPLATMGSLAFDTLGIPSIVQTKFWSDVVAAFIEGSGKYLRRLRRSQRAFLEIFQNLEASDAAVRQAARADVLAVWARRHQGASALGRLFQGRVPRQSGPLKNLIGSYTPRQVVTAWQSLVRDFSAEGSMAALTVFVLQNYHGAEAIKLADIIATHHERFLQWLLAHRPPGAGNGTPAA